MKIFTLDNGQEIRIGELTDSMWAPHNVAAREKAAREARLAAANHPSTARKAVSSAIPIVKPVPIAPPITFKPTPTTPPTTKPTTIMAPRTQDISEADFFANYKPASERFNKHKPKALQTPPRTPPKAVTSSPKTVDSPSKVIASAPKAVESPLNAIPSPPSSARSSSKLSANAAPFVVTSAKLSPIAAPFVASPKLSPVAAPFVIAAPKLSPVASPIAASPKLSPVAAPFVTASPKLSPKAAAFVMPATPVSAVTTNNSEKMMVGVQRNVIVSGTTGPWPQFGVACDDDNIITMTGLDQHELEFDDCVSETGLEDLPRQVVRATEGNDMTNQLVDCPWEGGKQWAPAPADWEHDRSSFDAKFIPNYCAEWVRTTPSGKSVTVKINNEAFASGMAPIDNDTIIAPLFYPTLKPNPNPADSDPVTKPVNSAAASARAQIKAQNEKTNKKLFQAATAQRYQELAVREPEPNPFTPTIDMYLRPAESKDAAGIAAVYNMAIQSSNIPEDQTPVTVEDIKWVIDDAKDKYPFIVAIRGSCPKAHNMHTSEQVIGFARAEPFDFGIAGSTAGRSRCTYNLHLYVDAQFRRNRVGYNLMDRLLHMISPSHAYMEGANWANPSGKKIYESGGFGTRHQLIFKIAVFKRDDATYAWLKHFLFSKFFFKETARLTSMARSKSSDGTAQFMDLVILQREASAAGEFEAFM